MKQIAIDAGATFKAEPKAALCRFGDRASLEKAMTRLAGTPMDAIRLAPARH
jgi:hypothetical protein